MNWAQRVLWIVAAVIFENSRYQVAGQSPLRSGWLNLIGGYLFSGLVLLFFVWLPVSLMIAVLDSHLFPDRSPQDVEKLQQDSFVVTLLVIIVVSLFLVVYEWLPLGHGEERPSDIDFSP